MVQFATAPELGAYLGETIAPSDSRATLLLQVASAAVQSAAKQRLEFVSDDVVTLSGDIGADLELPQRPVVAVTTVILDGAAVTDHTWTRTGLLRRDAGWGGPASAIEVTYSHGYTTIPEDVKAVTLSAAARGWQNPGTVQSESVGSYSVVYGVGGALRSVQLIPHEVEALAHYRRRSGTIRVGRA